ncbi:unnamed protein product [Spodoptera exigua]|nr:unnamed protein product [Spodoptera exigua]
MRNRGVGLESKKELGVFSQEETDTDNLGERSHLMISPPSKNSVGVVLQLSIGDADCLLPSYYLQMTYGTCPFINCGQLSPRSSESLVIETSEQITITSRVKESQPVITGTVINLFFIKVSLFPILPPQDITFFK